jgi:hypothetical protein
MMLLQSGMAEMSAEIAGTRTRFDPRYLINEDFPFVTKRPVSAKK